MHSLLAKYRSKDQSVKFPVSHFMVMYDYYPNPLAFHGSEELDIATKRRVPLVGHVGEFSCLDSCKEACSKTASGNVFIDSAPSMDELSTSFPRIYIKEKQKQQYPRMQRPRQSALIPCSVVS